MCHSRGSPNLWQPKLMPVNKESMTLAYHCDINMVVPSQAGQQLRQRLWEVIAAFVSQFPDDFLVLLVMLVQRIFLDHLLQLPKMMRGHFARVKLQQHHVITAHDDHFTDCTNSVIVQ